MPRKKKQVEPFRNEYPALGSNCHPCWGGIVQTARRLETPNERKPKPHSMGEGLLVRRGEVKMVKPSVTMALYFTSARSSQPHLRRRPVVVPYSWPTS